MIKEISLLDYTSFGIKSDLHTYYQTSNYAILMSEDGYSYEYLGYFENNNLMASSLVLYKSLGFNCKYAYAPSGFIADFNNPQLINRITQAFKKYLTKKNVVFFKINPPLIIKEYDAKSYKIIDYKNHNINYRLNHFGYKKLKDNLYFESQIPRFKGEIDLKNFNIKKIAKATRNKIRKSLTKGLLIEKSNINNIDIFYDFLKRKKCREKSYYKNLYKTFSANDMVDFYLVKVDYEAFMENSQNLYESELVYNQAYNELLKANNTSKNLNKKLSSDKRLISYKNDIIQASKRYSDNEISTYVGGVIVLKNKNKVSIVCSAYNPLYKEYNINYFIHYSLINIYKNDYDYLELNGITGDFSKDNPYYGLNKFNLNFYPKVYEYAGEFDLILNEKLYNKLLITGRLHKELDKDF